MGASPDHGDVIGQPRSCAGAPRGRRLALVVLTRQPVAGRVFTSDEALAALDTWLSACVVFEENEAVLTELLELVRRHGVKGKQVHDANVVATMRANGLKRLATFTMADFARFEHEIAVEALVS